VKSATTLLSALLAALAALAMSAAAANATPPASGDADQPLRPDDFAAGFALELPAGDSAPIAALLLPPQVYRRVRDARLADVRVFNAAGEEVPHAIRKLAPVQPHAGEQQPLLRFPLPMSDDARDRDRLDLRIERSADGRVLAIHSQSAAKPQTAEPPLRIAGYLLDSGASERDDRRPIVALRVKLAAPPSGMVLPLELEASDDLISFSPLASEGALVHLDYAGQRVDRDRIELSPTRARFLRMRCGGACPSEVLEVIAERAPAVRAPELERISVVGRAVAGERGVYRFDLGGPLPVEQLELELPADNTVIAAELRAGNAARSDNAGKQASAQLAPLLHARFYRVSAQGRTLHGPRLEIAPRRDRYYELRVENRGGGLGQGVPRLHTFHVPEQLLFARRGAAPFTLAYGSVRAAPSDFSADELLALLPAAPGGKTKLEPTRAALGAARTLGGDAALRPPPAPLPVKTYVLWAVLIAGVALLATLAIRLVRGMR
jgi:hypothetical protein